MDTEDITAVRRRVGIVEIYLLMGWVAVMRDQGELRMISESLLREKIKMSACKTISEMAKMGRKAGWAQG